MNIWPTKIIDKKSNKKFFLGKLNEYQSSYLPIKYFNVFLQEIECV